MTQCSYISIKPSTTQAMSHRSATLSSPCDLQASLGSKSLLSAAQLVSLPSQLFFAVSIALGMGFVNLVKFESHEPSSTFSWGNVLIRRKWAYNTKINFAVKKKKKKISQCLLWKFWIHWKPEIQKDSIKKENEVGRLAKLGTKVYWKVIVDNGLWILSTSHNGGTLAYMSSID